MDCLGRIRSYGPVGGGVSLGVAFEVSKAHARHNLTPSPCLQLVGQIVVSSQLLLQCSAWLAAAMIPAMMVVD